MFTLAIPATAFGTNCYVVAPEAGEECVVIDPGFGVVDRLREALRENGLRPAAVLLTHGHLDHTVSITTDAKDELSRVHIDNTNARKAEVTALLRYTEALRIVDNHLIVAAELDLASTARRLKANIEELYGCHVSARVLPAGATRPAAGYLIYVGKDAEQLARRTDEGPPRQILLIARLLADDHQTRRLRPLPAHALRRVAV